MMHVEVESKQSGFAHVHETRSNGLVPSRGSQVTNHLVLST